MVSVTVEVGDSSRTWDQILKESGVGMTCTYFQFLNFKVVDLTLLGCLLAALPAGHELLWADAMRPEGFADPESAWGCPREGRPNAHATRTLLFWRSIKAKILLFATHLTPESQAKIIIFLHSFFS